MPLHTSARAALSCPDFAASTCSSFGALRKPCLLGSPRRVSPHPPSYRPISGEDFRHHTAAGHSQHWAAEYVSASPQRKALIGSAGQFPWCKYSRCSRFQVTKVMSLIMRKKKHTVGSGEPQGACPSKNPVLGRAGALSRSLYRQCPAHRRCSLDV